MNDCSEEYILRIHQVLILILTLILSTFFCLGGFASCRPLPMYYYLLGVKASKPFERDPFMLVFAGTFILIFICLQICIEVKKYHADCMEKEQIKRAVEACTNLEEAILKLQNVCEVNMIPTVRIVHAKSNTECIVQPKPYRRKIFCIGMW